MNIKHTRFIVYVVVGTILGWVCELRAQDKTSDRADQVQLRVDVLNELSNPVPGNTFVGGEVVLIRGTLFVPEALDAKAALHRAQIQVQTLDESADSARLAVASESEAEAKRRFERVMSRIEHGAVLRRGLELITIDVFELQDDGKVASKARAVPRPVTDEARFGVGDLGPDAAQVSLLWEINSEQLDTGRWRLQVSITGFSQLQQVDFEVVSPAEAAPEQRSAAAYVRARAASARADTAEATQLAQEAIDQGPPLDYSVMAAYRLLGDVHAKKGNYKKAISAYTQAITICNTAFPKSGIPAILEPRVQDLEQRLKGLK